MKEFHGYTKGINLGGWLSQCGNNYNEEHYCTFIQKEDIDRIASMGMDHVRLPVDYNVIQGEDGSFIESGFAHVEDCLNWCEEAGLNVVFDLHKARGFVFDDKNYCQFFSEPRLQEQFIDLWKEVARRYGNRKGVVFELLNEVTERWMAEPWNEISARTIPQIRKLAPDTTIMMGGIYNSSIYGLTLLNPPVDDNMVYTFHCYSPMIFTHQNAHWIEAMPRDYHTTFPKTCAETKSDSNAVFGTDYDGEFDFPDDYVLDDAYFKKMFAEAVKMAERFDVPLYCGEYGVIDQADGESTLRWFRSMHKALVDCKIARCVWTYKQMDFGITDDRNLKIMDELISLL